MPKKAPPFLVFGAPSIGHEEIDEVADCLRSGWLGTGPRVARFEKAFAEHRGVLPEHVAAVNSCSAALHISMLAAGIPLGSEVITTPLTFCATVNAIIHAGLTPVLADVNPLTQNIEPEAIEAAITSRTRAIVPVHFAGRPCAMDQIMAIARRHDLVVIEDCAHAIESSFRGQKVGTFGDFGCFSFYVTKSVVTGEGGMIIGRSEEHIARARVLSLHGMDKDAWHRFSDTGYRHYQVVECGYKYNMMDLQAAIGLHQLKKMAAHWLRRQTIWNHYRSEFADLPVGIPADQETETEHGFHLYTLMIDEARTGIPRDGFLSAMHKMNIGTGVHYLTVPEHSFYQQKLGWLPERWPHAMRLGRQTVSLPLSPALTDDDVLRVVQAVKQALK